jgi:hypothetical protein
MKKVRVVITPDNEWTKQMESPVFNFDFNNRRYRVVYDFKLGIGALIQDRTAPPEWLEEDKTILEQMIPICYKTKGKVNCVEVNA